MFLEPMSRSELHPDGSLPDLAHTLEEHLLSGFPPDLALDLVLNELVALVAEATHAGGAALALPRGETMVCRAATGQLAPGLGVTLDATHGLSAHVCKLANLRFPPIPNLTPALTTMLRAGWESAPF